MKIEQREQPYVVATVLLGHHTWHVTPNYEYAEVWVESIQKEGLHGVLFHDDTLQDREEFIKRGIELVEVNEKTSIEPWIERYFIYKRMLEENEWMDAAFFTDARDIWFYTDPIGFFKRFINRGYFIVQEEWSKITPDSEFMKRIKKIKHRGTVDIQRLPEYSTGEERPFCAGAFGGSRDGCLGLFNFIANAFQNNLDVPEWDMAIFNAALRAGAAGKILNFGSGYDARKKYLYEVEKVEGSRVERIRFKDDEGEYPSPLFHDIHVGRKLLEEYRNLANYKEHHKNAIETMTCNQFVDKLIKDGKYDKGIFTDEYGETINDLLYPVHPEAAKLFTDNHLDIVYVHDNVEERVLVEWYHKVRHGGVIGGDAYSAPSVKEIIDRVLGANEIITLKNDDSWFHLKQ